MFFVDKPYISDFFKMTIRDNAIPIVGTDIVKELDLYSGTKVISESTAIEMARESDIPAIYTTSENSIGWISKHLPFSNFPEKIGLFKDKLKFRELTKSIFPNFYFKEIRVEDLKKIQFDELPLPFIIKPTVGFFSMGVYKISNIEEWVNTIDSIVAEIDQIKDLYPEEVLNTSSFIIEQCINGEEFAVDAYYNSTGEPVILSIFKHVFSSDADVSDRVYISSKEIIENNLEEFTDFAGKIGNLAKVKTFPVHIELRRDKDGTLLPIEVNPMRFGGWCTTADISFLAYGFNPYLYYYSQKKPNWSEVLKGKGGKLFSIIVLDNSTGIDVDKITSFNYEKLLSNFEKPIELRKIDYNKYSVFGFLFTETREDNFIELKNILVSDLNEYISTNITIA
ncbi:MAG: ATP-grasp domain-containing protein [Deltaproteobacteria bacterium]|nr:ATP-grasp domain-containing protein [Deltaproteobacteria bacterium]MBW1719341.1 ATP-grasp domain-containing protein [Deltaproteobacteria bacterium]MBW1938415.1 ATP-grasp domain-containing protein [Deltaproteobacteria bacterium]MBW1964912.1 ATP-grasp domain-containing protein [Deltaproteobacteria bacterium]MBW2080660.1 ATP-grasp domain-containing protein [Deltaproteobacteria bacterium]